MNLKQVSQVLAAQGQQHVLVVASHGTNTKRFLDSLDSRTRAEILDNVANHYGITREAAYEEVTDDEAESLLDYVTGPQRAATSLLMKRKGVTAGQSVVAELSDSDVVTVELRGSRDGIGSTFKAYYEDPYTGKPVAHPIEGKVVVTHWRKGVEQEGTFKIKEGKAIHFIRIETFDSRGSRLSLHTKKRNPWKLLGGSHGTQSEATAGVDVRKLETSLVGALKEFRDHAKKFSDTEHDAQAREDWETLLKRKRDRINGVSVSILANTEKNTPEIERPTINIAQNCLSVALTSIYADQPGEAASVARAIKVTRDQLKGDIAGLTHATDYRDSIADIDYIAGKITVMLSYIEKVANEAH